MPFSNKKTVVKAVITRCTCRTQTRKRWSGRPSLDVDVVLTPENMMVRAAITRCRCRSQTSCGYCPLTSSRKLANELGVYKTVKKNHLKDCVLFDTVGVAIRINRSVSVAAGVSVKKKLCWNWSLLVFDWLRRPGLRVTSTLVRYTGLIKLIVLSIRIDKKVSFKWNAHNS